MAHEGKYGKITAELKELGDDEPVFLFRATDPFTPLAIRRYAQHCQAYGCEAKHVQDCFDHADRIEKWQKENPTKVKYLPGS